MRRTVFLVSERVVATCSRSVCSRAALAGWEACGGTGTAHSTTAAPQLRPPPKPASTSLLPSCTSPCSTASQRAMGTDAAEVLPYLSTLVNSFSGGKPSASAADWMMRMFAWCGMKRSTSSSRNPACCTAASVERGSVVTANL